MRVTTAADCPQGGPLTSTVEPGGKRPPLSEWSDWKVNILSRLVIQTDSKLMQETINRNVKETLNPKDKKKRQELQMGNEVKYLALLTPNSLL